MTENERIKIVRNHFDLSMRTFADKLGVTHGAISLIETNQRNVTSQIRKAICREFNINETWLLTGNGDMLAPVDTEQEIAQITAELFKEGDESFKFKLIKLVSQMSDEQIRMCKEMIEKLCE